MNDLTVTVFDADGALGSYVSGWTAQTPWARVTVAFQTSESRVPGRT